MPAGRPRIHHDIPESTRERQRRYSAQRYARLRAAGHQFNSPKPSKHGWSKTEMGAYIRQRKLDAAKCAMCEMPCEEWNTMMFAWDHIDRAKKTMTLSQLKRIHRKDIIDAELDNCQLLCHCCHAWKTWVERDHEPIDKDQRDTHLSLFD